MSTALVTGGGRGIGRAICLALAQAGHDVAINYAGNAAAAEETRALCEQAARQFAHTVNDDRGGGARFATFAADVSEAQGVESLFEQVEATLGSVGILVNNAGITRDALLLRMSEEDFDAVLDTNLKGAFLCCKRASRNMVKQRGGRIVNITSVVGIAGNPGQANYAASKAGLIGLTKTLARELGSRNITVNAVAPGFIATDMTDAMPEEARTAVQAGIALRRAGQPEDIAALVAFLAGDAASYITGQVICVDGGMTL
ncbi:MAG: 3-oxoacyl-[acyl-carrier-protein] reductase [Coriobacteriales bacterium]|jgi:3-oxoacyl-[acyl-carrier protein] reductase|nr:3-oxoacyl-[acyl-carrier-protein] reductase [Coriobacteriales bacterium]